VLLRELLLIKRDGTSLFVYAPHDMYEKQLFWEELGAISVAFDHPWVRLQCDSIRI